MYKHLDDNKGKNQWYGLRWKVDVWNVGIVVMRNRKHSSIFSHRWKVIEGKIFVKKLSDN